MTPVKKLSIVTVYVLSLILLTVPAYAAKSVYVIADTGVDETDIPVVQAYEIQGASLILQTEYGCIYPLAIGVAIDESESGLFLFVTHEDHGGTGGDQIEIINAKTMQYVDTVTATGAKNLAGIVVDKGKKKVYAIDRDYLGRLYVYSWNAQSRTLTPDFPEPYYVQLQDCQKGFGIALDEENNRLYVADNTKKIKYYNTNTWSKVGEIPPTTNASCNVISVAIDVPNQFLYYGSMGTYGQGDPNLYKYNISTQTKSSVVIGSGNFVSVAGIAVDQETSLVYITVYGGPFDNIEPFPKDRLMVYNSSLQRLWYSSDIGNPAGVAVSANVGYKEPYFSITKDSNVPVNNCVVFDQHITFDIEWDANGHSDTNAFVIDYLPSDLEFLFSEPNEDDYNSVNNTLKWYLPGFNGNSSGTIQVTARVKSQTCTCGKLKNIAYLEGDNYCSAASEDVNYCWDGIIYVDKDVTDSDENGITWYDAFKELQDALTAIRKCEDMNVINSIWVAEGVYKPVYDTGTGYASKSFELIDGISLLGHFAGYETSPEQRDFANPNNQTILEGQIGQDYERVSYIIKGDEIEGCLIDGFTVQLAGSHGVYLEDCNIILRNCKICNVSDTGIGIYALYGYLAVTNSIIEDNQTIGIKSQQCNLLLKNSIVRNNHSDGVQVTFNGIPIVINNWIYDNTGNGISLLSQNNVTPIIRNNTICRNSYGIGTTQGKDPNIRNCIIYYNNHDFYGTFSNVKYCCLQDGNLGDPCNITNEPDFINPSDLNDFHISNDLPCKDAGDPDGNYGDETDIDGEPRIKYGRVDIGADEYYWSSADFDRDGDVDFTDYAEFAYAWLRDVQGGDFEIFDLKNDDKINCGDLELFSDDWLWQAGWLFGWMLYSGEGTQMMAAGAGTGQVLLAETSVESSAQQVEFQQAEISLTVDDVEEIFEWMDTIWPDIKNSGVMTEGEFLEFREDLVQDLLNMLGNIKD